MNSKHLKFLFLLLVGIAFFIPQTNGEGKEKRKNLSKIQGLPNRTFLNINNISTQIYSDGNSDIKPDGNSGVIYPKGSGKGAVFESGLVWGALIPGDPQPRVGGSTYSQGLQTGKILSPGVAESPDLDKNRIYRVRPDIFPGGPEVDLTLAAIDEGSSASALRAQYETDWTEWPVTDGAPFNDVDSNGVYDPNVDIPGVPGADQTIWFVANDLDANKTSDLYGAQPIGIEMQATFWAYAQAGALGNMFFRKYTLINKSNTPFNDMYVAMWSDVDLGNATDDYSGCDTTLSLGYTYNATNSDATYDPLPPPAVGFDFFQGPIVAGEPSDTAIFNGQYVAGMKNLPMTAFIYYARGDATVTDPQLGALEGSTQWYNFMQGKVGKTGEFFVNPITNQPTTFVLTGDPQTNEGWLDGLQLPAGDRRQALASGPFQMAVGDTQEVVIAEIIAGASGGVSNLDAVGLLKTYDQKAQEAYDAFFVLPAPPPRPNLQAGTFINGSWAALDKEIVLDWGSSLNDIQATENYDFKGFTFEGYNVYQLPSASAGIDEAKRLATYDITNGLTTIVGPVVDPVSGLTLQVPQQYGSDIGIQRYLRITRDAFTGRPLVNGIRYYFAVTAYAYNPDSLAVPNNLENPIAAITVIPQEPNPGVRYNSANGDTVQNVTHTGPSDGNVIPIVLDPSKVNGHSYRVNFLDTGEGITWSLTDVTANQVVLADQTNQSGDASYIITNGIMVKVQGPPVEGKSATYASADPPNLSPVATAADPAYEGGRWFTGGQHGGEIFFGGIFLEPNFWGLTSINPGEHKPVMLKFRPMASFTDLNGNSVYDIGEPYVVDDPAQTQKAFMYQGFSPDAYLGFFDLPFTAWDVSDPANPRQLNVVVRDRDENHQWDLHHLSAPADPLLPNNGDQQFNYTWILNTTYDPTGAMYGDGTNGSIDFWSFGAGGVWDAMWAMWIDDRGVVENASSMLAEECNFTLIPNAVNTAADEFSFTAPTVDESTENAKVDVNKVNVFPNPYYGVNTEELNKYNRFVTFTHLPDKATIRIFNLAGILIQTIQKDDQSQFTRWDLANDAGLPVASGLYIAHIEMPVLGITKILKVAIIQEQQILDRF